MALTDEEYKRISQGYGKAEFSPTGDYSQASPFERAVLYQQHNNQAANNGEDDGIFSNFFKGGVSGFTGALQGQGQFFNNVVGVGDGATAKWAGDVAQDNARSKNYSIGEMLPFASDYWTNGSGAAYDVGNMLGSSALFAAETALITATGGAAAGAIGAGASGAAKGAGILGRMAQGAKAGGNLEALAGKVSKSMAESFKGIGMGSVGKALESKLGTAYALNILKTPLEVSSEMGSTSAEVLEAGGTEEEARRAALVNGMVQAPLLALSNSLEVAGLGKAFDKAGGKQGFMNLLSGITREALQNAWEEGMQQSSGEFAKGQQSLTGVINPFEWSDEALQQAAAGAVGGLAIGGGHSFIDSGVSKANTKVDNISPINASTTETTKPTAINENISQSQSNAAREYLRSQAENNDSKFSEEERQAIANAIQNGSDDTVNALANRLGFNDQQQQATDAVNQAVAEANGVEAQAQPQGQTAQEIVSEMKSAIGNTKQAEAPATTPATPRMKPYTYEELPMSNYENSQTKSAIFKVGKYAKKSGIVEYKDGQNKINFDKLRSNNDVLKFLVDNPYAIDIARQAMAGDAQAKKKFQAMGGGKSQIKLALIDILRNGYEPYAKAIQNKKVKSTAKAEQPQAAVNSFMNPQTNNVVEQQQPKPQPQTKPQVKSQQQAKPQPVSKPAVKDAVVNAVKKPSINIPKAIGDAKKNRITIDENGDKHLTYTNTNNGTTYDIVKSGSYGSYKTFVRDKNNKVIATSKATWNGNEALQFAIDHDKQQDVKTEGTPAVSNETIDTNKTESQVDVQRASDELLFKNREEQLKDKMNSAEQGEEANETKTKPEASEGTENNNGNSQPQQTSEVKADNQGEGANGQTQEVEFKPPKSIKNCKRIKDADEGAVRKNYKDTRYAVYHDDKTHTTFALTDNNYVVVMDDTGRIDPVMKKCNNIQDVQKFFERIKKERFKKLQELPAETRTNVEEQATSQTMIENLAAVQATVDKLMANNREEQIKDYIKPTPKPAPKAVEKPELEPQATPNPTPAPASTPISTSTSAPSPAPSTINKELPSTFNIKDGDNSFEIKMVGEPRTAKNGNTFADYHGNTEYTIGKGKESGLFSLNITMPYGGGEESYIGITEEELNSKLASFEKTFSKINENNEVLDEHAIKRMQSEGDYLDPMFVGDEDVALTLGEEDTNNVVDEWEYYGAETEDDTGYLGDEELSTLSTVKPIQGESAATQGELLTITPQNVEAVVKKQITVPKLIGDVAFVEIKTDKSGKYVGYQNPKTKNKYMIREMPPVIDNNGNEKQVEYPYRVVVGNKSRYNKMFKTMPEAINYISYIESVVNDPKNDRKTKTLEWKDKDVVVKSVSFTVPGANESNEEIGKLQSQNDDIYKNELKAIVSEASQAIAKSINDRIAALSNPNTQTLAAYKESGSAFDLKTYIYKVKSLVNKCSQQSLFNNGSLSYHINGLNKVAIAELEALNTRNEVSSIIADKIADKDFLLLLQNPKDKQAQLQLLKDIHKKYMDFYDSEYNSETTDAQEELVKNNIAVMINDFADSLRKKNVIIPAKALSKMSRHLSGEGILKVISPKRKALMEKIQSAKEKQQQKAQEAYQRQLIQEAEANARAEQIEKDMIKTASEQVPSAEKYLEGVDKEINILLEEDLKGESVGSEYFNRLNSLLENIKHVCSPFTSTKNKYYKYHTKDVRDGIVAKYKAALDKLDKLKAKALAYNLKQAENKKKAIENYIGGKFVDKTNSSTLNGKKHKAVPAHFELSPDSIVYKKLKNISVDGTDYINDKRAIVNELAKELEGLDGELKKQVLDAVEKACDTYKDKVIAERALQPDVVGTEELFSNDDKVRADGRDRMIRAVAQDLNIDIDTFLSDDVENKKDIVSKLWNGFLKYLQMKSEWDNTDEETKSNWVKWAGSNIKSTSYIKDGRTYEPVFKNDKNITVFQAALKTAYAYATDPALSTTYETAYKHNAFLGSKQNNKEKKELAKELYSFIKYALDKNLPKSNLVLSHAFTEYDWNSFTNDYYKGRKAGACFGITNMDTHPQAMLGRYGYFLFVSSPRLLNGIPVIDTDGYTIDSSAVIFDAETEPQNYEEEKERYAWKNDYNGTPFNHWYNVESPEFYAVEAGNVYNNVKDIQRNRDYLANKPTIKNKDTIELANDIIRKILKDNKYDFSVFEQDEMPTRATDTDDNKNIINSIIECVKNNIVSEKEIKDVFSKNDIDCFDTNDIKLFVKLINGANGNDGIFAYIPYMEAKIPEITFKDLHSVIAPTYYTVDGKKIFTKDTETAKQLVSQGIKIEYYEPIYVKENNKIVVVPNKEMIDAVKRATAPSLRGTVKFSINNSPAIRAVENELQRGERECLAEILTPLHKAGATFEPISRGSVMVTMPDGRTRFRVDVKRRIIVNESEAEQARRAHGYERGEEGIVEGYWDSIDNEDMRGAFAISRQSRRGVGYHELGHAAIEMAYNEKEKSALFDRADKLVKEMGEEAEGIDSEELACDAVMDFCVARDKGYITTFTKAEQEELSNTPWGRAILNANELGAKTNTIIEQHAKELNKTLNGKLILAKYKLQRGLAKLMQKAYDMFKAIQAFLTSSENFHNTTRKLYDGTVFKRNMMDVMNPNALSKFSIRKSSATTANVDARIDALNQQFKAELNDALLADKSAAEITNLVNKRQEELAELLGERKEAQKLRDKARAEDLAKNKADFAAGKINEFKLGNFIVSRRDDGSINVQTQNEYDGLGSRKHVKAPKEKLNTPWERTNSIIKRSEVRSDWQKVKDWVADQFKNFYKNWINKYDNVTKFDKAAEEKLGIKIKEEDSMESAVEHCVNFINGGTESMLAGRESAFNTIKERYNLKNDVTLKSFLEEAAKLGDDPEVKKLIKANPTLQNPINAVETYILARGINEAAQNHFIEHIDAVAKWESNGGKGERPVYKPYAAPEGMSEEDARAIIKSAHKSFEKVAQLYYDYNENLLQILDKSGVITPELHKTLNDKYKYYCPLVRDYSDTNQIDSVVDKMNGGRSIANVTNPLMRRKSEGSSRDVMSLFETTVRATGNIMARAERNICAQELVARAKAYGIDKEYAEKVPGNVGDSTECIFTVIENGKKVAYKTTPELYEAVTNNFPTVIRLELSLLKNAAEFLRVGATSSPSFILKNLIRDTIFAGISSRNGFIPVWDTIQGYIAYKYDEQLRGEYDAGGVSTSNMLYNDEERKKYLDGLHGGEPIKISPSGLFKAVMRIAEDISNTAENATRMGEFRRARLNGKSVHQAAIDAIDVTLNFNRSGVAGQEYNRVTAFFNACMQGGDKMYRLLRDDFVGTSRKIFFYITLPSIILWCKHHDEPWYEDIDPYLKNTNWFITKDIRIPKPQEAGILFGSGPVAILEQAKKQDRKAITNWAREFLEAVTPSLFPTLFVPMFEALTNYSLFRDKPIENARMQKLKVEDRYGSYTSETAKLLGKTFKLSPVKIDNTIRGYTGTMGMTLAQMPDLFVPDKQNLPKKYFSEMPFIREFMINESNKQRVVNDFYALRDVAQQQHNSNGKKNRPTKAVSEINKAGAKIANLRKDILTITNDTRRTPAQKRIEIDRKNELIKRIAQATVKRYGNMYDY